MITRTAFVPGRISLLPALLLLLLLGGGERLLAQEADPFGMGAEDSLLFGDEFDLGSDDFSFDLDDTGTEPEAGDTEEDDGLGDFFGEEDAEDSTEDTTTVSDEWGFDDDLFAQDSTADSTAAYTDHPLDFRRSTQGTALEGTGMLLSVYSPYMVHNKLDTWYSFLDVSLTIQLPYHFESNGLQVATLVDISSFNFENSFPAGGDFRGVSVMPMAKARYMGLEGEAGLGLFYPSFGMILGGGYGFQIHSLTMSVGYRWNWASKIDPIGAAWWLEPRFTIGIDLR